MAYVLELFDSRKIKGSPPQEALFRYAILECNDEEEAEGLLFGALPADYRDLELDVSTVTLERGGEYWFTAEATFILPAVPDFPGGGGEIPESASITEFDTTGGTQHITQCISQVDYGPEAVPDIRLARVVGLNRDGVEGVDVVIPKLELSRTVKYDLESVTSLYIKNLARLTGKTNIAPYAIGDQPYEAGELLFIGATGKQVNDDGDWKWEITYRFSASENRQNIVISPTVTVVSKKGHDYLWVLYKKDVADNRFVEVPDVAFVSKVYEEDDFNTYIATTL